jgi:flagellin
MLRDSYRTILQNDVKFLVSEIQSIVKNTSYNGERLFDGSSFRVSVGGGRQGSIQAAGIDIESLTLDLSRIDVSTMEGAFDAYDTVQSFSERLVNTATKSLDNAEDRITTIRQSLDLMTGQGNGSAASSPTGGAGYSMSMLSVAQLIQSYQPNVSGYGGASSFSLFA